MLKRLFIAPAIFAVLLAAATAADSSALERARDRQDRAAIDQSIAKLQQEASDETRSQLSAGAGEFICRRDRD